MTFKTKAALASWADDHTTAEILAFYNALPDAKPVKRFEDRKIAVSRIWAALGGDAEHVAPPVKKAMVAAPKAAKAAKKAKPAKVAKAPRTTKTPRTGSKQSIVQDLVSRPDGATLTEIMKLTGWQKHTVRGFVAGTLKTKLGLKVLSTKGEDGERRYAIAG